MHVPSHPSETADGPPLTITHLAPGFEGVRDVFSDLLTSGRELGAGISVRRQGRPLFEAHGGWQDTARTRPFGHDTLAMTYSTGKPIAAIAALRAVGQGQLDLDAPASDWWPRFAGHGKGSTTLRQILSHTAGLPAFSPAARDIDALDAAALIADLEESSPAWEPGTAIAEHALTYGHLIDGALSAAGAPDVRSSVAAFARQADLDLHFGVPADQLSRVADLEVLDAGWVDDYLGRDLSARALSLPVGRLDPLHTNSAAARMASFPADGLLATASSLARFYEDLTDPAGLLAGFLGAEAHRELLTRQAVGRDLFLDQDAAWSLGLSLDDGEYGMGGIGGSCAWFAPGQGYAFAYVTRGLGTFDRVDELAEAAEAAFAEA